MTISLIAAIGEGNRVLGKDNKLLWNIPEDAQFFRDTTKGHVVIMGRKTFESIGHPLPQRTNIVVTRDSNFQADGVIVSYTLKEAMDIGEEKEEQNELFIIGGGQLYREALPLADRLYLTIVQGQFEGDTFFPEYVEFEVIKETQSEGNGYHYIFQTLERKQIS